VQGGLTLNGRIGPLSRTLGHTRNNILQQDIVNS
jgi:hypothetical protein